MARSQLEKSGRKTQLVRLAASDCDTGVIVVQSNRQSNHRVQKPAVKELFASGAPWAGQ
jgi:hypothetical protein